MSAANLRQACHLLWFCRPACDRQLFRAIKRNPPSHIVQLGVGDGVRAKRILQFTQRYQREPLHYTGIDLFEADQSGTRPRMLFKQAHREFSQLGAKVRLVPGELDSAVARTANGLGGNDLLVIDAMHGSSDLSQVWFFVPRMLAANAMVAFYTSDTQLSFLTKTDVEKLANQAAGKRRAA